MKKATPILETIKRFIDLKKNQFNTDLVNMWSDGQETQINVSPAGGKPVPGKNNCYRNDAYTWGNVRIPKDSASEPHFYNYPAQWPLELFANHIGMSGWNWRERMSYWVGFEIDDLVKHLGTGVSKEEIELVIAALKKLPYVMIRRGTSGTDSSGIHVYVFVIGIPTANHDEHAILARAIVAKIAGDTGLKIQATIDACGRILWFWALRASEEKRSYECLQASTVVLTEDDLPGWRDSIPVKPSTERGDMDVNSSFPTIKMTAEHDHFFAEYQKRGWVFDYRPEYHCYHMHRAGMAETAESLGLPLLPQSSPGTDKMKANVKVYLRRKGFYLVCFGNIKEGPDWGETEKGAPSLNYSFVFRPVIKITTNLDRSVEESIQSLRNDPNTFQHGVLTEVVNAPPKPELCLTDNGAPQLRLISTATMARKLSACANFEKYARGGWVPCLPQDGIVKAVLSSAEFPGIPVITNVVSSPMLRVDGTIARVPGYDPLTGLYLNVTGDYPDIMPTEVAVAMLKEVVADFPFVTEKHCSAWIAALVTIVSRVAFPGPSPFFLANANMPGVGKTMAFDAITSITEARSAARYGYSKNNDELRKVITTVALSGSPYLFFDNVDGRFGGPILENVLTTNRWADRILGGNRSVDIPWNVVILGTGNNCRLTSAMVRRTCAIELRTDLERPDLRKDFLHPDLLDWIKSNQRELVIAAISIPAQYILAGSPKVKMESWGSFEGWSHLVRASLIHAGLPDPDTREALATQADDETSLLRQLMDGWEELGGMSTVGDAIKLVNEGKAPALTALLNEIGEKDYTGVIGRFLRDNRGRVVGNRKFERTDHKIPKWQLVKIPQGTLVIDPACGVDEEPAEAVA